MKLVELPLEILLEIYDNFSVNKTGDLKTLLSLRQTCKRFHDAACSYLRGRLRLWIGRSRDDNVDGLATMKAFQISKSTTWKSCFTTVVFGSHALLPRRTVPGVLARYHRVLNARVKRPVDHVIGKNALEFLLAAMSFIEAEGQRFTCIDIVSMFQHVRDEELAGSVFLQDRFFRAISLLLLHACDQQRSLVPKVKTLRMIVDTGHFLDTLTHYTVDTDTATVLEQRKIPSTIPEYFRLSMEEFCHWKAVHDWPGFPDRRTWPEPMPFFMQIETLQISNVSYYHDTQLRNFIDFVDRGRDINAYLHHRDVLDSRPIAIPTGQNPFPFSWKTCYAEDGVKCAWCEARRYRWKVATGNGAQACTCAYRDTTESYLNIAPDRESRLHG